MLSRGTKPDWTVMAVTVGDGPIEQPDSAITLLKPAKAFLYFRQGGIMHAFSQQLAIVQGERHSHSSGKRFKSICMIP